MQDTLSDKKKRLIKALSAFDSLAVALSGGVDSAVLLAEAHRVLGKRVIAITVRSPIHPDRETADAAKIANCLGVEHVIFETNEIDNPEFLANPPERCYICKKAVFGQLIALARQRGVQHLAHGANADDNSDYRPGLIAARELGVAAPLMDAGLNKQDIRHLAKKRDLFVWDKPSMACIATRFPYGTPISHSKVEQIKQAEQVLVSAGLKGCRVRHHGDVARIEVPLDQLPILVADPLRQRIVKQLRMIGFPHVSADLEGYISGSMNRVLGNDPISGFKTSD